MDDFPDDLVRLIFAKCSAATLASLECVSKRYKELARAVPLNLHVTPAQTPTAAWMDAHADNVTKLTVRRVNPYTLHVFPNVAVIDVLYTTVKFWNDPNFCYLPFLKRLRVCHLSRRFGQPDVFRTSLLPPSLVDLFLTFDDTWRRVDIDQSFPKMALRCREWQMLFRQPDFHVTCLRNTKELYLKTHGCITTTVSKPTLIRKTVVECHDNFLPRGVLKWFGPALDTCVIKMPAASFVFSQDLAHVNPASLTIEGTLVVADVLGSHLRNLRIKAMRFASVAIPPDIDSEIIVDDIIQG